MPPPEHADWEFAAPPPALAWSSAATSTTSGTDSWESLLDTDTRGDKAGEPLRDTLALLLGEKPAGREISCVTEHWGETACIRQHWPWRMVRPLCAITALPGVAGTVRFPQLLVQLAQLCDIWQGSAASRLALLPQLRD
uniref:Uncharacterized protein n=1 Tax=Alexandrium catenella TaxID=2925 RepID=A0A7S1R5P9_ALECA|mmetsp:Transcript_45280/g.121898  ORF Transcript_45280/g.121898 Transcript_45280/m.121898 type:complete len:139 (+) Transcript_45280:501-917(+)